MATIRNPKFQAYSRKIRRIAVAKVPMVGRLIESTFDDLLDDKGKPRPGKAPRMITGEYRKSFKGTLIRKDQLTIFRYSTDHPIAYPLEFGSSKSPPHPHFRVGLRRAVRLMRKTI